MTKTNFTATALFVLSLTGCGAQSGIPPENIPAGYVAPPMPDATENSKTIAGIDSNTNGVRDDVEIYIYTNYSKPEEQKALMQFAKMEQNALLTVKTKEDVSNIYYPAMSKAISCEEKVFGWHDQSWKKLNSQILNTMDRVKQDLEVGRLMGGGVYEDTWKGDPCE